MSTGLILRIESIDSAHTSQIGVEIGRNLRGGELIELRGDLGSGKTTFVKGLAEGMGSVDKVHSPSFTLSNEYKGVKLKLYHFDFYRLNEAGIMKQEINELLNDPAGVVVVEWPDIVEEALPSERLLISFSVSDENTRQLTIKYPEDQRYLIDNLTS